MCVSPLFLFLFHKFHINLRANNNINEMISQKYKVFKNKNEENEKRIERLKKEDQKKEKKRIDIFN